MRLYLRGQFREIFFHYRGAKKLSGKGNHKALKGGRKSTKYFSFFLKKITHFSVDENQIPT
jgi:hypothetical protein